jgi:hypothetical protein
LHKAPYQERALSSISPTTQAKQDVGSEVEEMSRHNRPASSWGESEQEIQDIGFALIALQEIGPTVKRPGLPGASSFVERSVSPCRRRSASVEERKRGVEVKFEMKCKNPARARESGSARRAVGGGVGGLRLDHCIDIATIMPYY